MSPAGGGVNALGAPREGGEIPLVAAHTPSLEPLTPVLLVDRLAPLHAELIALLRGLEPDDWQRPTVCALWSVRDIAARLVVDDLRRLSSHRAGHAAHAGHPVAELTLLLA